MHIFAVVCNAPLISVEKTKLRKFLDEEAGGDQAVAEVGFGGGRAEGTEDESVRELSRLMVGESSSSPSNPGASYVYDFASKFEV